MEKSDLDKAIAEIEFLRQDPRTERMAISREIHLKDQLQRLEDARGEGMELRDREIILNMHKKNMSAESIAELTIIPLQKVKGIIESV